MEDPPNFDGIYQETWKISMAMLLVYWRVNNYGILNPLRAIP